MIKEQGSEFCGYMVVRKPEQNFELSRPGMVSLPLLKVGNIFYGGLHRLPWVDVSEDYHLRKLPNNIRSIYDKIFRSGIDATGLATSEDFSETLLLLNYSNKYEVRNQIIAIYSNSLRSLKVIKKDPISYPKTVYLGKDVIALHAWSLLQAGYFKTPENFVEWRNRVNENGLFTSQYNLDNYKEKYMELSNSNIVEPLPYSSMIVTVDVHLVTDLT